MQHQIVGEGWIELYELYAEIRPAKQHKTPQYGLDFTMEYTLDSGQTKVKYCKHCSRIHDIVSPKAREQKVSSSPPNQTLGHECDRTINLDRIGREQLGHSG